MADKRLFIPALGGIYAACEPYALPLLRAVLGLILIPHGCQKLFGMFGGMGYEKFSELFDKLGYKPGWFWGSPSWSAASAWCSACSPALLRCSS